MTLAALRDHAIQALAAAAIIGGGATVIDAKVDNVRQDAELAAQKDALSSIPDIQKDVRETRDVVVRLEERSKLNDARD